jgi:hypothetical protein
MSKYDKGKRTRGIKGNKKERENIKVKLTLNRCNKSKRIKRIKGTYLCIVFNREKNNITFDEDRGRRGGIVLSDQYVDPTTILISDSH